MDIVAGIAAARAFRRTFVTASMDRIDFRAPIKVGEFAETIARIARVGRTSVTLEVELWAENPADGERRLATIGTFVMVAVDEAGHPTPLR
ncbi:MAG: acyl-CoA thioesterase [Candidatus Baltobacteraceae bacterium]